MQYRADIQQELSHSHEILSVSRGTPSIHQAVSSSSGVDDGLLCCQSVGWTPSNLRYAFHRHVIAQTLQGLYGPLAVTFLLLGSLVRVALLLIIGPLPAQMIRDHQNLMSYRYRGTLAPKARFEAPEGASQKGRGLAGRPCTVHQDTPQVPMPFAGAPLTTLARTGIFARTDLRPGREAGRRAKPAHVRANLAQDVSRRGHIDAGNTVELLDLRQQRLHEHANLGIQFRNRPLQHL